MTPPTPPDVPLLPLTGLAVDVAAFVRKLIIPQGRWAGSPFFLMPWQQELIEGHWGDDAVEGDSGWSAARANAKTTFSMALAAATIHPEGPLVETGAECAIVNSSFDQGLIGFRHLMAMMQPAFDRYPSRYRIQDSANRASIHDRRSRAQVTVKGSDPKRLHGLAPGRFNVYDEVAQWPPGQIDAMLAALTTARGKIEGSRALWTGTRPDRPTHLFAQHLAGGAAWSRVYAADPDDDPYDPASWAKANPSLEWMPDLQKVIEEEAQLARKQPSKLASFRALRLNLGIPDVKVQDLVTPEDWERRQGYAQAIGDFVLGLDIGQTAAMTGAAAFYPDSGRLSSFACYPELPPLDQRGAEDGVGPLYLECQSRNELIIAGRRVSDLAAVLLEAQHRWGNPALIVTDAWREGELRDTLERINFPACPLEIRHNGFQDGAEDVRYFQRAVLDGTVTFEPSLLLTTAARESRVASDSNGHLKHAKGTQGGRRANARDDVMSAAIIAVAAGQRSRGQPDPKAPSIAVVS